MSDMGRALDAALQRTRGKTFSSEREATAEIIAAFLDELPLDLRVKFPRPMSQPEMDRRGPFKAMAAMLRDATAQ